MSTRAGLAVELMFAEAQGTRKVSLLSVCICPPHGLSFITGTQGLGDGLSFLLPIGELNFRSRRDLMMIDASPHLWFMGSLL